MAELIEGTTGHTHYAPLSHGQTVAISRHLQEQIRQLQAQCEEFQSGLNETNEAVADLKKNAGGSNAALVGLQDSLANTNSMVEANRNELSRTNGKVHKLQAGLDGANENIAALRDAQKVTATNVQKLAQDLTNTTGLAKNLQEALERKIDQDIGVLRDDLSRTNLELKHLRAEEEAMKATLHADRDAAREADHRAKEDADALKATNTLVKILEDRAADTAAGLKSTRLNLEDLNTATLRLHEDHENTKAHVNDLQGNLKKVHNHVKQVHGKLDATATALNNAQGKLDQDMNNSDKVRLSLESLLNTVQSLKEGHDRANSSIQTLHRELAEVGATTQAVKAGLKEQSSLLLPNINMDSAEARMASARHGSLLQTSTTGLVGSMTGPKRTARTPASVRNSQHDQMAWT